MEHETEIGRFIENVLCETNSSATAAETQDRTQRYWKIEHFFEIGIESYKIYELNNYENGKEMERAGGTKHRGQRWKKKNL